MFVNLVISTAGLFNIAYLVKHSWNRKAKCMSFIIKAYIKIVLISRQGTSRSQIKVRWNFLLVACCSLVFACCSLLFTRCSLLFTRCSLPFNCRSFRWHQCNFSLKRKLKKWPLNSPNTWLKFAQIEGIFFRINYEIRWGEYCKYLKPDARCPDV